jgi:KDO2-lipid IV(A) lauroyltransferase
MAHSLKHRLEYAAFKGLFLSTRLMSRPFLLWWGRLVGSLVWKVTGFRRAVILDNLRHAFPERDHRWHLKTAHAFYRNLGMTLMEFFASGHRSAEDLERNVQLRGEENLQEVFAGREAAVLMSGHFGNFELLLPRAGVAGLKVHGVAKPQRNKLIDRFHNSLRMREGVGIVPTGGSVPRLLELLKQGESVGLLGDQDAGAKGQFVPFLNRPASVHRGPAMLAVKAGVPLVIFFLFRQPDHSHILEIAPALRRDPQWDDETAIARITEQHTALLEDAVRRRPEMYYWLHRRWKTRPPPEQIIEEN